MGTYRVKGERGRERESGERDREIKRERRGEREEEE